MSEKDQKNVSHAQNRQTDGVALSDKGGSPEEALLTDAPNYMAFDQIDRAVYTVVHPEQAMAVLGISSRTAHRKMNQGEFLFTLENGAKRLVIPQHQLGVEALDEAISPVVQANSLSNQPSGAPTIMSDMSVKVSDATSDTSPVPSTPAPSTPVSNDITTQVLGLSEQLVALTRQLAEKDALVQEKDRLIAQKDEQYQALTHQLTNTQNVLQRRLLPVLEGEGPESSLKALIEAQGAQLKQMSDELASLKASQKPFWKFW